MLSRSLMTKGRFFIAAVNSEAVKALERLWSTDLEPIAAFEKEGFRESWNLAFWHTLVGLLSVIHSNDFSNQAAWIHLHTGFLATWNKSRCISRWCPWHVGNSKTDSGVAPAGSEPCWSAQDPRVIWQEFKKHEKSVDSILLRKYVVAWLKLPWYQIGCIFLCKFN